MRRCTSRWLLGLSVLPMAACGDAYGADLFDDDLPMGMCSASGGEPCPGETEGLPAGFPCAGTAECATGVVCVAPFADGEVGDFTCSNACVPAEDETQWC